MSYTFELKTIDINFTRKYQYAVITTNIENVKPEIIKKRLIDVPHVGINGGYFQEPAGGYSVPPPTILKSISYWKGDTQQYNYNGVSSEQFSRKTFISYFENGKYKAEYRYVKNLNEALSNYPNGNVKAVIGGNDYNEESYSSKLGVHYTYALATNRTVLTWNNTTGKAHLIVTHSSDTNVSIPTLKSHLTQMGFDPANSIVLDGSCSTKMRVPVNGVVKYYGCTNENRYIGNMIRVYGTDFFG